MRAVLAALALCAMVAARAEAQSGDRIVPPARIESPRGMALGTGARASAASSQAQADNVANLVLGGVYHVETFVGYDPTFKRVATGGAVVDSMTSRLAAGASTRFLFGSNDAGKNEGWEGRVALAYPIADMLSIGVAGRYANLTIADQRAYPERPVMSGQAPDQKFKVKAFTMDAALTLRPVPGLAIAGLAYNIIDTDSPLAPMMVGGSVAFSSNGLTLGADVLFDLNKHEQFEGPRPTAGGGLEYLVGGVAPVRVGYAYDRGRAQNFVTAGLGYVDAQFGAQLSLRQRVGGKGETALFFGVQYFVQ